MGYERRDRSTGGAGEGLGVGRMRTVLNERCAFAASPPSSRPGTAQHRATVRQHHRNTKV